MSACLRAFANPAINRRVEHGVLPNMFNRGALHAEEACEFALVYPVPVEQEQSLRPFDRSQGRFFGEETHGLQR